MADEDKSSKTEEPTPRKLEDAHKKGDVVKSQEVGNWAMIAASTLAVALFAGPIMLNMTEGLRGFMENTHDIRIDPATLHVVLKNLAADIAKLLAIPLTILVIAAIGSNMVQHRPVLTLEKLKPKFEKINPIMGLKQKFSLKTIAELIKNIGKLLVVGFAVALVVWPERDILTQVMTLELTQLLQVTENIALRMLVAVLSVMALIALADYAYQRWETLKKLRMSVQDIRDEHKDTEGDPMIKARIRQLRMERSRTRMMAAVPEATVVVTNPTHFAVALKYEHEEMDAPIVVAKGADLVAKRIRDLATENNIPIVENPSLARGLFAAAEIDEPIPLEHYKAVAEVISYVFKLRRHPMMRPKQTA